jgi:hypothetical protein
VDDEAADELAAEAIDALVWEGGVLDFLELVLLEKGRVEMVGIVEGSLAGAELDGIHVFVLNDSSDQGCQTFEADLFAVVDDLRFCF